MVAFSFPLLTESPIPSVSSFVAIVVSVTVSAITAAAIPAVLFAVWCWRRQQAANLWAVNERWTEVKPPTFEVEKCCESLDNYRQENLDIELKEEIGKIGIQLN